MNGRGSSSVVIGFALWVGLGTAVAGQGSPQSLLVVVETMHGMDVDAAEVRPAVEPSPISPSSALPAPAIQEQPAAPDSGGLERPAFQPSPPTTVAAQSQSRPARSAGWTVAVAAGPSFSSYETAHVLRQSIFGSWSFTNAAPDIYRSSGSAWRIDVRHQADGSTFFTGVALEGCQNEFVDEIIGAMATAGTARKHGNWIFEARAGAGVDLVERQGQTVYSRSTAGTVISSTTVLRPGLFVAGGLAVGHMLSTSLELLLTVDIHQSLVDEYDGYFGSTLGLRYRL